jgi:hypothetical protein
LAHFCAEARYLASPELFPKENLASACLKHSNVLRIEVVLMCLIGGMLFFCDSNRLKFLIELFISYDGFFNHGNVLRTEAMLVGEALKGCVF